MDAFLELISLLLPIGLVFGLVAALFGFSFFTFFLVPYVIALGYTVLVILSVLIFG